MKKIILLLLLTLSVFATEYKVIYNLQTGKDKKFNTAILKGIPALQAHYKAEGDSLKVVVIISNKSYKYFMKNEQLISQDKFRLPLKMLAQSGVRFEMCSVGMKKNKIKKEILYKYVHPVFNRTASLIGWQNRGFAVIDIF